MQKNDVVTVTIEDIGVNGEGIGKVDGYTLFIKDAMIGDVMRSESHESEEALWLCEITEDPDVVRGESEDTGMSDGEKMWWLSDSGNEIFGAACI